MSEHPRCPDCGAELPTGATAGLCPKCLLGGALEGSDALVGQHSPFVPTTPQPGGFVPPGVQSLAASFPQLEIVGLLGHGGMGAVYKARQTKLDRFVALKIIRPESADDPAFAERFTREARTLARLSHPNIVAVHDFGELPGGLQTGSAAGRTLYYFVMEYVDGANLRELMQSGGLQPEQALAIVPQICDALQYAHDEGVVHRDIKPENILVDPRGRVKIADFGLAKLAAQAPENFTLTATHQVMGTPRYMAPEQMAGSHAVDHRADIYSLGVVFYEMLTGELPMGSFEPPSRKTDVDPRLDQVVLRALAREPERRYQRASEVRTDVESILRGELAVSRRPSSDSRPEPERGQSAGEAIWEIAGLLARGWLVYLILMVCLGAIVLGGANLLSWLGKRSGQTTIASGGLSPGLLITGLVVAVIGVVGLVSVLRHLWKWMAGRNSDPMQPSTASLAASADLPPASVPSDEWSASQAVSRPGASTVLERQVAGIVNRLRGAAESPEIPNVATDTPRFSRKAIMGACWAAMFFLAVLMFLNAGILLGVYFTFEEGSPRVLRMLALAIASLVCVVADYLILRGFWRAASRPPGAEPSASSADRNSLTGASVQSLPRSSAESQFRARAAVEAAEPSVAAPSPAAFPDLDLRRIQMELQGPASGLVVVALLSAVWWCVIGVIGILDAPGRIGLKPILLGCGAGAAVLLAVGVLIYSARHMRRLTGYDWCLTATILAVIPWSVAVLVGLPVGIWAFRLLRRQDVRDAFLAKAIERERAVRPSVPRSGRDWVTLTREQVEDDDLPDVCMVCGAPTQERVNKEFSWAPDWAGFLCLLGLWPGVIAMALTGKSMRAACPLCPADRGHWSRLVWVSSAGWLVAVPLAALGYFIVEMLGGRADAPLVGTLAGAGLGLILWLIPVIYLSSTRVSAKSITDDRITLQRVSPAFARAVSVRRTRPTVDRELSTTGRIG